MQLTDFFPYRLAVTAESFSRHLVDVYQTDFGLTREEWRLLFLLADVDQITSLELSKRTSLDKVQVSRAADRLNKKGLITRATPSEDRRLRLYSCTEKGHDLFATVHPLIRARAASILDAMPDADRAALEQGITALYAAIHRIDTQTA
ncbi:DNA-binding transcriptional regulator, MarR family [Thalassovita litoralis]|uniref:DNA-binding transcriptional regulator, MarR family n=1 Tax=Thalassovita litoralis TaxID=1010611 RepID=A0A521B161_9RHOB|nr:MarR family winged helix-turn-helix transcriptional regulator [Thalassovita litoralis]SMO40853.1 DNA-binding transcriptional regulator, MarR family [Thalassovita litoralis]